MTRTQIQDQLTVIKANPSYSGLSYATSELSTWLTAQGVSDSDKEKILADIESYAY